ncbi:MULTISPECIES: LysR substrate-binding domain-containing protein [unclassified Halomonas]|uniref:LysR family transcriptional regulator n=1 Tax=unclassified Halomonas TaxID=2609666 RepID=UPI00257DD8B3|nr:LysR substrate-binding domain-containing protein [Halomonas sp.]MCJ8284442.1 LysR substrate-binding domain-containing protein [Halomonas sp.]NQY69496.1 LysR family transcriptional regulator [Halomonas sp.]
MDASDLRFFLAVCEAGSMSGASEALFTVQSNVTSRIRKLEDELGTTLFVRGARGVALTPAGERLLPHARRVSMALRDASASVSDSDTLAGRLSIGALETTTASRLSPYLAAFTRRHPDVDLSIITGTSRELVDQVLAGRIDGAFVGGRVYHKEIEDQPIFKEELVVVAAKEHRDLSDSLGMANLKLLVLRPTCVYRTLLETLLIRNDIRDYRVLEFATLESIIGGISANIGISLLPRFLIDNTYAGYPLSVHAIDPSLAIMETTFISARERPRAAALRAFLDIVRPDNLLRHPTSHLMSR